MRRARRRPGLRRIVDRIAGRCFGDHQVPAQRALRQPLRQFALEIVRLGVLARGGGQRFERGLRLHRPAHEARSPLCIDEAEGIHAVVFGIRPAARPWRGFGPGLEAGGFRIPFEERGHLRRIGLAGGRVGSRSQQLRVEARRRGDGEERKTVHRHPPLLPVIGPQRQRQAAHARLCFGTEGIAATDRQATLHRRAWLPEHPCTRQRGRLCARFEVAGHADAPAVRAPEAGEGLAVLDVVHQTRCGESRGRPDPSRHPGESQRQAEHQAGDGGPGTPGAGWRRGR